MQTAAHDDGDLIDLSLEDDALLPPSLRDDFVGFRLSVSERSCCAGRLHGAAAGNDYDPDRKSLSWHTAFLNNEGILDAEELMMYNRGFKKAELPVIKTRNASNKSGRRPEPLERLSRSYSMPRVPANTTATVHKKRRSWMSTGFRSGSVPYSECGSAKNMLKTSISFLKRKVGSGNSASSASSPSLATPSKTSPTKSKAKIYTSLKDGLSAFSPSTPPHKEFSAEGRKLSSAQSMSFSFTPPTKETMFQTRGGRPSGLRLPSARFGFFDLEERPPSSRWEEIFHTAPKSTPQESPNSHSEATELAAASSANRARKKLRGSVLSPVPYAATAHSDANDKENNFNVEAGVDNLSKHLSSIDLDADLLIDPQGKKGTTTQLCVTDHSVTPFKRAALSSVTQRTPLAAYNRSLYSCASSRY